MLNRSIWVNLVPIAFPEPLEDIVGISREVPRIRGQLFSLSMTMCSQVKSSSLSMVS